MKLSLVLLKYRVESKVDILIMLNSLLKRFTDRNVVLRQNLKTEALQYWKPIVDEVVQYVKERENRFSKMQILSTGSYYERSKVGEPDEFDLMLVVEDLELDDDPYDDDEDDGMSEPPEGFTRVMIDGGEQQNWRNGSCVDARGMLNASRVKSVFARHVRDAIEFLEYGSFVQVRSQGPAVTLIITNITNGREYSIDLTLAIKDKSWPEDAVEWIGRSRKGWPDQDLVQTIWHDGCHLVAKQPKGSSTVPEHEKGFLWRYSFSSAEKKLFLQGDHVESSSCRKQVLRILKALNEKLNLQPLKSYHLKTMLLYESEANPHPSNWIFDRLGDRFMGLLQRLGDCLRQKKCPHYFMRELNLFETFPEQKLVELFRCIQVIKQNPEGVLRHLTA
ncbi:cyclic GMP-AMP synthase-like receptor 1 [Montipora capricornis]|uniref:cyclic GMP-AMP synthase-like receptor 1 n=1 Tax=Montipora capricornis TaxID=246305 RepID=UPI0035F13A3A